MTRAEARAEQERLCEMYNETVYVLQFWARDERVYVAVLESAHDPRNDDRVVSAMNPQEAT